MRQHSKCRFHIGKPSEHQKSSDPRDDCPLCQSYKDTIHSSNITRQHVYGSWCKDHNHCAVCCEIKHLVRVLKHYGGTHSTRKCPVCEWARDYDQKHNVAWVENTNARFKIVRRLYHLMLGIEPKKYWEWSVV